MGDDDAELSLTAPQRFVSRGGEKLAALLAHADYAPAMARPRRRARARRRREHGRLRRLLPAARRGVGVVRRRRPRAAPPAAARRRARRRATSRASNARRLGDDARGRLPRDAFGLVVVDLSFISLTLVLGALWPFVGAAPPRAGWRGGRVALLVKPQFEGGAPGVAEVGRGATPCAARPSATPRSRACAACAAALPGCAVLGSIRSPVRGAKAGNREFFLVLEKTTAEDEGARLDESEDASWCGRTALERRLPLNSPRQFGQPRCSVLLGASPAA